MTGSNTRPDDSDLDKTDPSKVTGDAETSPASPPVDAATSPETIAEPGDGVPAATLETLTGATDDTPAAVIYNKDGSIRKKPGRKPGQKTGMAGQVPGIPGDAPAATPAAPRSPAERKAQRVASEELARAVLATSVGSMIALVGPEWDFQSPEEAAGMKAAVAAYIDAKGDGKLSPESMLLLVVAGYALPRAAHENTREKFGRFFRSVGDWLKSGFRAIFSR